MTDKHTPEDTIANYTAALGKRLNEIRRLEGVNTKLLEALEGLREDLQARLDDSTDGATVADGLVSGEDANRSWSSWLFDVMRTHGDIARAAIKAAKGDA